MIKGAQKNVIIIKDTNSAIFEQAIFIVKPGNKNLTEVTLLQEARRIVAEKTNNFSSGKKSIFQKFFTQY